MLSYRKDQPSSSSPLAAIQLPTTRQAMRSHPDCQATAHAAPRVVTTKAALTMPTLIVNGDQDRDNGDPAALTAALPDAVQAIVPGTHMSCVTKPDLSEAIRDFLTGTAAR